MLGVSLALFLLSSRAHRQWLCRPGPWLALLVALLVFSPVIVWNAQHQWASFIFQSSRTLGQRPQMWKDILMFWLVQIATLGPLPFVLLGAAALQGAKRGWVRREDRWTFVISFFLPLFALFLLASFKTEVHVNWTAPSYL